MRAVYRAASPSVVLIDAGDRTGSGFLVDARGHVVTNAHVVGDRATVDVDLGGRHVAATVRGVEPSVDVAVLALKGSQGDVPPLPFGDSAGVRIGDPVVAIGAPFGLNGSLSSGIVSGLRRQIDSPNGFAIQGVIQTDAALNPGNSGGPCSTWTAAWWAWRPRSPRRAAPTRGSASPSRARWWTERRGGSSPPAAPTCRTWGSWAATCRRASSSRTSSRTAPPPACCAPAT